MSKASNFVMFVAGAAIGSAATWYITKTKYEQILQEEIDSVKEVFSKKEDTVSVDEDDIQDENEDPDIREKADFAKDKPNVMEYTNNLIQSMGYNQTSDTNYTKYSNVFDRAKEQVDMVDIPNEPVRDVEKPYVISPDEFGEMYGYSQISLTYFADQILADDNDELVEDVERVVGFESLNHFGEYEDDSVFVRNDRLKCDYEILLDMRKYSDVLKSKPYLAGV